MGILKGQRSCCGNWDQRYWCPHITVYEGGLSAYVLLLVEDAFWVTCATVSDSRRGHLEEPLGFHTAAALTGSRKLRPDHDLVFTPDE